VGCDDALVCIYNGTTTLLLSQQNSNSIHEPVQVLLGNKNGFPVFDVDCNWDGQSLLSAGGDGVVQLWDTMDMGPFREVAPLGQDSSTKTTTVTSTTTLGKKSDNVKESKKKSNKDSSNNEDELQVPGLHPETTPYKSGVALAVYRNHSPNASVWSVAFSPLGYYFAMVAADAMAQIWTMDQPSPVQLLTRHSAANVHCITWHPNCNYVLMGLDN